MTMRPPNDVQAAEAAIASRRSIRAFLPKPVPRETVERILAVAARAPSGTNTQPWKVYVLTGRAQERRCPRACVAAYDDPVQRAAHTEEYAYYPTEWVSPYIDRRRKVGWDLYGLLGIGKTDKARMHAQHRAQLRVLRRAGRPHVHDRPHHAPGQLARLRHVPQRRSWSRRAATACDTCPQAAFTQFHRIIMPSSRRSRRTSSSCAACRSAIADWRRIENTLVTEREPVEGVHALRRASRRRGPRHDRRAA